MRKMCKKRIVLGVLSITFVSLLGIALTAMRTDASSQNHDVPVACYELDKGNDYDFSSATPVDKMSFGGKSLGTFSISGSINDTSVYSEEIAYGVDAGSISFSYSYSGNLLDEKADNHLVSDKTEKLNGEKLDVNILKGVLLVQKSSDGVTWESAASPVVNFFETNPSGKDSFYTTSGTDIVQGKYFRVIVAYKTEVKTGESSFLWWDYDNTKTFRNVEVYEFYLCKNDAIISIHNLKSDEVDFEDEEFSAETLRHGETLKDGSTTTAGFYIDKLGTSYVVTVNGLAVDDGAKYTINGKYTIVTTTKLGYKSTQTVYIFNGYEDMGYETYFGDSLVQGKRVFREGDYPTYAVNSKIKICEVAITVPAMTGTIKNMSSGEVIELKLDNRTEQIYELSEGTYCAELFAGNTESGTYFHYTIMFNVLSEDAKPYVNYNALMNLERFSDLASKHYEVVYPTTAGGYINVCFASYDDAFAYAYEIEKRYVEKNADGVYYKSEENPNVKVKYKTDKNADKIKLTSIVTYYAKQNVEIGYFNTNEAFTYQTFESEDSLMQCLETMSIFESIKVFPSQEEKDKLLQRTPFLNEYCFMHVDDYDVVSVAAYCHEDQNTYNLEFGKKVDKQLTVSSNYTIVETNEYGDELSYDTCFMSKNVSETSWLVINDGMEQENLISEEAKICADTVSMISASNILDEGAIVRIEAPELYTFDIVCLVSEMDGLVLYKKGIYTLTFVDRVGNTYQLHIDISGKNHFEDVKREGCVSYTELYNRVYINDKPMIEEVMK